MGTIVISVLNRTSKEETLELINGKTDSSKVELHLHDCSDPDVYDLEITGDDESVLDYHNSLKANFSAYLPDKRQ